LLHDDHHFGTGLAQAAFPSISHERLPLMLLYAGLPQDAIDAICDIYTNVRTQVCVPAGTTAPISVNRGVIQGDVISPLIFNLFLEPMLKWLQQGEDGYTPSCLTVKLAELGYADDLSLLNTSAAAAQRQLHKVHRFAEWAGMDLNVKKCAHSALLAPGAGRKQLLALSADGKSTAAVTWKGTPLPYLQPHEPYKYLGVWTSLDLNTKTKDCLKEKLATRITNIVNSEARGIDALTVIRETVLPCVEHAMAAAVLPLSDVAALQTTLNQAFRKALGVSPSTCGDLLTLPVLQGGFGLPSLMERYVKGRFLRHPHIERKRKSVLVASQIRCQTDLFTRVNTRVNTRLIHEYSRHSLAPRPRE
jgi:hypothetical protein